jgi:hypothetical protein
LVEDGGIKCEKSRATPTRNAPTIKNRIRLSALICELINRKSAAKLKINI